MSERKHRILGLVAGLFSLMAKKPKPDNLFDHEFRSSGQRIGLTFSEKVRDNFRRRWIKRS